MKLILQTEWAYATSPAAEQAKAPKGCYLVEQTIIDGSDVDVRTVATGFNTLTEANAWIASKIQSEARK